jgi:hypothetical protein
MKTENKIADCISPCIASSYMPDSSILTYLVETETWWWRTVTTSNGGTDTDNVSVNGARHAVVQLDVELWQCVLVIHGGLVNITNGRGFNHVTDGEALDSFVLWDATSAVGATDGLNVSATLLVTSVIPPLGGLFSNQAECQLICQSIFTYYCL